MLFSLNLICIDNQIMSAICSNHVLTRRLFSILLYTIHNEEAQYLCSPSNIKLLQQHSVSDIENAIAELDPYSAAPDNVIPATILCAC